MAYAFGIESSTWSESFQSLSFMGLLLLRWGGSGLTRRTVQFCLESMWLSALLAMRFLLRGRIWISSMFTLGEIGGRTFRLVTGIRAGDELAAWDRIVLE